MLSQSNQLGWPFGCSCSEPEGLPFLTFPIPFCLWGAPGLSPTTTPHHLNKSMTFPILSSKFWAFSGSYWMRHDSQIWPTLKAINSSLQRVGISSIFDQSRQTREKRRSWIIDSVPWWFIHRSLEDRKARQRSFDKNWWSPWTWPNSHKPHISPLKKQAGWKVNVLEWNFLWIYFHQVCFGQGSGGVF